MAHKLIPVVVGTVALGALGSGFAFADDGYQVQVLLPSATKVVVGGPVLVNGFESGTVDEIRVEDGQALVSLTLEDEVSPLHSGAVVTVGWKATLSERLIEVTDAPEGRPEIPDGGMIKGDVATPTEIDDVLNALDPATRERLQSLTGGLADALDGSEKDVRATLTTGGPALQALGELLQALGTDGPAIRNLVARLDNMLSTLAARDEEVTSIVDRLAALTQQVSTRREDLRASFSELPSTIRQADDTLNLVPSVVEEAVPLLQALEPATARLAPVASDLRPILRDLRPLAADLRPALRAAAELLSVTPGLIDDTSATIPGALGAIRTGQEPVAFARPYSPEIVGFFSTWASAFSNYDSNGNFARIHGQQGPTSFNENPGVLPPGVTYDPYPAPGQVVGQPWTDATGSEMR